MESKARNQNNKTISRSKKDKQRAIRNARKHKYGGHY